MTPKEAYEEALKQIPRDYRWFKDEEGEWYQADVNEQQRRNLAREISKSEEYVTIPKKEYDHLIYCQNLLEQMYERQINNTIEEIRQQIMSDPRINTMPLGAFNDWAPSHKII